VCVCVCVCVCVYVCVCVFEKSMCGIKRESVVERARARALKASR